MTTLPNKKMYKSKTQLGKLTKDELEEYGRTIGIELDKRLKHGTLVDDIEARMRSLMPWSLKLNTLVDDIEVEILKLDPPTVPKSKLLRFRILNKDINEKSPTY